jgi:lysophospholipase L1-like esterase
MTTPSPTPTLQNKTYRIAFFGDSITEVGRSAKWHGGASLPERNWCFLATRALEIAAGIHVVRGQFGIGGQNTYEGLGRIDVLESFAPDLVVVAFGANDCCHHFLLPEETHLASTALVTQIHERFGADSMIVGTGGDNPLRPFFRHLDGTLTAQKQAAEDTGVPFVDVRTSILQATKQGEIWGDMHLGAENCHPNDRGHEIWGATLLPHLQTWAQQEAERHASS